MEERTKLEETQEHSDNKKKNAYGDIFNSF